MSTETCPVHRKLEPVPTKMQHLPIDERGYAVPWFVEWIDGKPDFRVSSQDKLFRAIKKKLCWVCGSELGTNFAFVAGPMCGINRISSEPPSHLECARWSARNCPFLSNPNMVRREDEVYNNAELRKASAGFAIARNPGVAMVWITRQYEVVPDGKGKFLLVMGEPREVEWYACGQTATRAQVIESIDSGFPALEAASQAPGAMESLQRARKRFFERYLPK
jgi:hypothetical protein